MMKRVLLALVSICCGAISHATEIENRASLRTVVQQTLQNFERAAEGGYRASHSPSGAKFAISESGITTIQSGVSRLSVVAKEVGRQGYSSVRPLGTPLALKTGTDRFGWPLLELKRAGLTEQYLNVRGGMRHAFQIASRPAGETGNAFIKVAVSGASKISAPSKTALDFQVGGASFQYKYLTVWDAKNRRLAAKLVPAKDGFFISIDDRSATYPVTVDPDWSFTKRLFHPTDPSIDTLFGSAVAIDGFTVAVGAQNDDWVSDQGKVYVFVFNGTDWVLQQAIQQSDTSVNLPFGHAISLDGNRLAAAAGSSAFIFERTGSVWTQVAEIPRIAGLNDYRINNNSFKLVDTRLVVGAPGFRTGQEGGDGFGGGSTPSGKIYLFTQVGGVWQEVFSLAGDPGDRFGRRIGFDGNRVVAIKPNKLNVFNAGPTSLTLAATVAIPEDASSTDVSGNRIAVGFPRSVGANDGLVRIYVPSGNTFVVSQTIASPFPGGPREIDLGGGETAVVDEVRFGSYVDLMGDVLGADLLYTFAAPGDRWSQGEAVLFRISDTTATFTDRLKFGFYEYRGEVPLFQLQSGRLVVGIWQEFVSEFSNQSYVNVYDNLVNGLTVTFAAPYEVGGKNVTGQVNLATPAPAGGMRVSLITNSPNMTVPSSVTVPAGASSLSFTANTLPVGADGFVDVIASSAVSGVVRTPFEIRTPRVGGFAASATEVAPGGTVNVTFTLQAVAGPGGVPVTLSANKPGAVRFPSSLVVPQGQSRLTVPVSFYYTAPAGPLSITAGPTYRDKTVTINVVRRNLSLLTVNQTVLRTLESTQGTVHIDGPAPVGGQPVRLTLNHNDVVVPETVTIPAGATSTTFTVSSIGNVAKTVYIYAGISAPSIRQYVTIKLRNLKSIVLSPATVTGGTSSSAVVKIDYPAPVGGTVVQLRSQKPSLATVPATVTIPAGSDTITVPIPTAARNGDPLLVFIYANLPGMGTQGKQLRIVRPVVSTVSISPSTVVGGTSSTGTVTLNGPAAAGGLVVKLSSQKPTLASVPLTVVVPAGATSVTFPITTFPRAGAPATSNIYASIGTDSVKAAVITVTAP
jgi:hypothetical protein